MNKVYIVYDNNDGTISRVFNNEKSAKEWLKKGHDEGWLYDEDCNIYDEIVYSSVD